MKMSMAMNNITVQSLNKSYQIYIRNDFESFISCFNNIYNAEKCVLITDSQVDFFQGENFEKILRKGNVNYSKLVFENGEKSKSLKCVEEAYQFLHDHKVERNAIIIAFGGGVIGDLSGFIASTYLRGIRYIHVPTSLIAQIDSSIGGKTGLNFSDKKNLIGSIYPPEFIFTNISTLKTLKSEHVRSGLAECLCHGLIDSVELVEFIQSNATKLLIMDDSLMEYLIRINCSIKKTFVEEDELDKGRRMVLNFGHTFGHAIEAAFEYELLHGECVGLGMICAYKLANQLGMVDIKEVNCVVQLIETLKLPINVNKKYRDKIIDNIFYDKKITNETLKLIVPTKIGAVTMMEITDVSLLISVIDQILI